MIKNNWFNILSIYFFFLCNFCYSQRDNTYTIDASAILGTEQTPFWMRANKFGKVPTKGETMAVFAGVKSDYQNPENKIDWGYGLNIGGFAGLQNKFIIQQAYAKAKWRAFELYAGRQEEIQGLVDTTLTSGSYIWSGNALPMPKVDLSIPNYTQIGPSGIFSIKGNYAHGWFNRNRQDAKGVMLHQKSFYFRIGKPNYKLKFYGGFNHQAQWGGKDLSSFNRKFGSSIKDYLSIVSGKSNVGTDTTGIDPNSAGNRTGNHLGSLDFGFELEILNTKVFLYRQSIFEDGSLFYLNNISDGLNGLSITFGKNSYQKFRISKLNLEFLNTLSQGGIEGSSGGIAASKRGQDDYFNNGDYSDGWSYNKTTIGTPFILSNDQYLKNSIGSKNTLFFTNNRIQAFILGFSGVLSEKYLFESKISFTKNWGTYRYSFPNFVNQKSFYINVNRDLYQILGGINAYMSLAGDIGRLLNTNIGVQIGIRKSFGYLSFLNPTHRH